jgi:hypothetical protein
MRRGPRRVESVGLQVMVGKQALWPAGAPWPSRGATHPSGSDSSGRGASPGMPLPAEGRAAAAARKDTVDLRNSDDFAGAATFLPLSNGFDSSPTLCADIRKPSALVPAWATQLVSSKQSIGCRGTVVLSALLQRGPCAEGPPHARLTRSGRCLRFDCCICAGLHPAEREILQAALAQHNVSTKMGTAPAASAPVTQAEVSADGLPPAPDVAVPPSAANVGNDDMHEALCCPITQVRSQP